MKRSESRLTGVVLACALGCTLAGGGASAAVVQIDPTSRHQQIAGLGGYGAPAASYNAASSPALIDSLVNSLGLTLIGNDIPVEFEQTNDNDDPMSFDWSAIAIGADLAARLRYLRKLDSAAVAAESPLRFFLTHISPPGWMKSDGSINGGTLNDGAREELAERLCAYLTLLNDSCGFVPAGVSLQLDPWRQSTGFPSCQYTPELLGLALGVARSRLDADDGLRSVSLSLPEVNVFQAPPLFGFVDNILGSPSAIGNDAFFAVTGWEPDGATPLSLFSIRDRWTKVDSALGGRSRQLWQTLNSTYLAGGGVWGDALRLAYHLLAALKYGKASAWAAINYIDFFENAQPTPCFYAFKCFYRFVRPGADAVVSTTDDDSVEVIAFTHDTQHTLTVVLLNLRQGEASVNVAVSGAGLSGLDRYTATSVLKCTRLAQWHYGDTLLLPPSSITTLTGDYAPSSAGLAMSPFARATAVPLRCARRTYDLCGRMVTRGATPDRHGAQSNVRVVRSENGLQCRLVHPELP